MNLTKQELSLLILLVFVCSIGLFLRFDLFGFDGFATAACIKHGWCETLGWQPAALFIFNLMPNSLIFFKIIMFSSLFLTLIPFFILRLTQSLIYSLPNKSISSLTEPKFRIVLETIEFSQIELSAAGPADR